MRIGIAGLVAAGAAAVALAPAAPADAGASSAADCAAGNVCAWSGANATGTMCGWDDDSPDWRGGLLQCRLDRVRSVMNNGRDHVQFYRDTDYRNPVLDPLPPTGEVDNVDGPGLVIRSHRWMDV